MRKFYEFMVFTVTLVLYSNVILYLHTIGKISFPPFFIYISSILLLLLLSITVSRQNFRFHPVLTFSVGVMAFYGVDFLTHFQTDDGVSILFTDIYLLLIMFAFFFVYGSSERILLIAKYAILAAGCISVLVNVYDFLHPFAMLPLGLSNPGRAAGFYVNPNGAGIALVLSLLLTVDLVPRHFREIVSVFFAVGVVLTFSRGAIITLAVVIMFSLYYKRLSFRKFSLVFLVVLMTLPIIATVMLNYALETKHFDINNIVARLDWFSTLGQARDYSENERLKVAHKAIVSIGDHPLFGTGTSDIWSWEVLPHNMYLLYAVQYGFLGWIIYPLFLLSSVARGWRENMGIYVPYLGVMLLFGLVSHNMMDTYFVLMVVAVIAALGNLGGGFIPERNIEKQILNSTTKTLGAT